MEHLTLVISMAVVSGIMLLTMYALSVFSPNEKSLADWAMAGACFLSSNMVVLTFHTGLIPFFPSVAFINAFYITGHAFIFSGTSRFLTGHSMRWLAAVVFVLCVFLHFIPDVTASVNTRLILLSPMVIALEGASLMGLWRERRRPEGRAFYPVMTVIGIFMVLYGGRVILLMGWGSELTFTGDEFMQTSGSLLLIAFYFLMTICFSVLVFWRKEIDLRAAAMTDHLTGCLNRKALDVFCSKAFSYTRRKKARLAFIMLDIDHFKRVNDTFGHATGDTVIKKVSQLVSAHVRQYDALFRFGGEEFLLVVQGADDQLLLTLAERIRASVASERFPELGGQSVTVSMGVAITTSDDSAWQQTLSRADKALYEAKQSGRNKVFSADGVMCTG